MREYEQLMHSTSYEIEIRIPWHRLSGAASSGTMTVQKWKEFGHNLKTLRMNYHANIECDRDTHGYGKIVISVPNRLEAISIADAAAADIARLLKNTYKITLNKCRSRIMLRSRESFDLESLLRTLPMAAST